MPNPSARPDSGRTAYYSTLGHAAPGGRLTLCASATRKAASAWCWRRAISCWSSAIRKPISRGLSSRPVLQMLEALNVGSIDIRQSRRYSAYLLPGGRRRFGLYRRQAAQAQGRGVPVAQGSPIPNVAELKRGKVAFQERLQLPQSAAARPTARRSPKFSDIQPVYLAPPMRAPPFMRAMPTHGPSGIRTTPPRCCRAAPGYSLSGTDLETDGILLSCFPALRNAQWRFH